MGEVESAPLACALAHCRSAVWHGHATDTITITIMVTPQTRLRSRSWSRHRHDHDLLMCKCLLCGRCPGIRVVRVLYISPEVHAPVLAGRQCYHPKLRAWLLRECSFVRHRCDRALVDLGSCWYFTGTWHKWHEACHRAVNLHLLFGCPWACPSCVTAVRWFSQMESGEGLAVGVPGRGRSTDRVQTEQVGGWSWS